MSRLIQVLLLTVVSVMGGADAYFGATLKPFVCPAAGLTYNVQAVFQADNRTVVGLQWLNAANAIYTNVRYTVAWERVGTTDSYLTTLTINNFNATVDGPALLGAKLKVSTGPSFFQPPNLNTIIELNLNTTLPSEITTKTRIFFSEIDSSNTFAGTILRCVHACPMIAQAASTINWFRSGVLIAGASSEYFTTTTAGRYSCELALSDVNLRSDPIWVGTPVFDCPFNLAAWCPAGATMVHENLVKTFMGEDDLRQPGNVFVCGSLTNNAAPAISTRGHCPIRDVCNADGVVGACSNPTPVVYAPCNTTISKLCPTGVGLYRTGSAVQATERSNRFIITGGTVKVYCGSQTEIYAMCADNATVASLQATRTTATIGAKDPWIDSTPSAQIEYLNVTENSVLSLTCPGGALMQTLLRDDQFHAIGFVGAAQVAAPKTFIKTVTGPEILSNWSCIAYTSLGVGSNTGTRTKLFLLNPPPPTTPGPTTVGPSTTTTITTTTLASTTTTTGTTTTTSTTTTSTLANTTLLPTVANTTLLPTTTTAVVNTTTTIQPSTATTNVETTSTVVTSQPLTTTTTTTTTTTETPTDRTSITALLIVFCVLGVSESVVVGSAIALCIAYRQNNPYTKF
ncbi:membrane protein [Crucian carp herpesvirus]|uniref:Membrane ORF25C n=1 Tax=Cyprinid herpesvirus 2 TaxID=317878 RepID=A0A0E3X9J8_CYHV2|nr:hypothetical protein [Cyprinid herpesvirus 2]AMB21596.1 membrane ORF25C [Cyprinid herpesvirus 2]APB92878.1 membrane protein [Crucian carp herpesvirus]